MNSTYQEAVIGALCGLAGAMESADPCSDAAKKAKAIALDAIRSIPQNALNASSTAADILAEIDEIKYTLSPSCKTCACPCGNTSAHDIGSLQLDPDAANSRDALISAIASAQNISTELLFRSIMAMSYLTKKADYLKLEKQVCSEA